MRDLTELFCKELTVWTQQQAATLLRIDACLLAGRGVMLAGGAVRDAYFGVKEKDYDFVFYNATEQDMLTCLQQFKGRSPYEVEYEVFPQYDGGDERIITVVKVTEWRGPTPYCMDWILYRAKTYTEVLEAFDHTINAFYMKYDPEFHLHVGHHGEWGVCTHNAETDCSPERVERFKEMARIADWEYVE